MDANSAKSTPVPLPTDFFPDCWDDDERMDNLFAPFRAKSVNLVNYQSKLVFWKGLIKQYSEHKGSASISIGELRQAFERENKKPHCLTVVIDEQLVDGTVKPKSIFVQMPEQTWSGWAVSTFVKRPLSWGFNKVKERVVSPGDSKTLESLDFVILEVVKVGPFISYKL